MLDPIFNLLCKSIFWWLIPVYDPIFYTYSLTRMCRFTLILAKNNLSKQFLDKVLFFDDNSIFKQCYLPPYVPQDEGNPRNNSINLEGYGIGYYLNNKSDPIIYKNTIPSWNDYNFIQHMKMLEANNILIHIRATKRNSNHSPVHIYNCHPFIFKNYLYCHNGYVQQFYNGKIRKTIINFIDDNLLLKIGGNTDSEYLFYIILTFIKNGNTLVDSVVETIKFIVNLCPKSVLSMNIVLSDGEQTVVTRYINLDKYDPPSLYVCLNHDRVVVSSEPLSKFCSDYAILNRNSLTVFNNKTLTTEIINLDFDPYS